MRSISIPFFFIVIVLLTFEFSSCGDGSTSPVITNNSDSCGSAYDILRSYLQPNFVMPSTYTLASERYFNFYIEIDSICTDHHVTGIFTAQAKDTPGVPIKFTSAIEWSGFWEETDTGNVVIHSGQRDWDSKIEDLGLRVPFGDNAAKVFLNIYVHFPTRGSITQDTSFLRRNLTFVTFRFYYNFHKPRVITSDGYKMESDLYGNIMTDKYYNERRKTIVLN